MKISKLFTKVFAMSALLMFFFAPLAYAADTSTGAGGEACEAVSQLDPGKGTNCNTSGPSINKLIRITVNILSLVAGVIAVIMVIISGLKYVTSQGDATQAASARKTLLYAITGIIVVAFAQIIVKFVLGRAT
jgi:hypothetical protein